MTRNFNRERQLIIFPELRRRRAGMIRAATTANRPGLVLQGGQQSSSRLGVGQERQVNGDSRGRLVQREETSSSINSRPVPSFNSQLSSVGTRRLTNPVSPRLGRSRQQQTS